MDYVTPKELVQEALVVAERKASLSVADMLIRGILSGVFLGFATSLAVVVTAQGLPPIVGAVLFPVGFVMLVLLGLELATAILLCCRRPSPPARSRRENSCAIGAGYTRGILWAAFCPRWFSIGQLPTLGQPAAEQSAIC